MQLTMLSVDDVLRIHDRLCVDFGKTSDPIAPAGVRDQRLLESAVARQHVGFGPFLKYSNEFDNAATLTFGVCSNHAFHNGNKRTALVAMLAHLDANKQTLINTKQRDLERMILALAQHAPVMTRKAEQRKRLRLRADLPEADAAVRELGEWLRARGHRVRRGERRITYKQLNQILKQHGYELAHAHKNSIDICKSVRRRTGFLGIKGTSELKRVGNIGYPGENRVVGVGVIKRVRKTCRLREEDGCDTESFYEGADNIDAFINEYRTVLRRLADK